jgi:YVTN family beta-propeller protein
MTRVRWAIVGVATLVVAFSLAVTRPFGDDLKETAAAPNGQVDSPSSAAVTERVEPLVNGDPLTATPVPADPGVTTAAPTTFPVTTVPSRPTNQTTLVELDRIGGDISPKSVVASQHGVVFAQNMIYNHTVTVYDANTGALAATIDDRVTPSDFGIANRTKSVQGGPVEAAFLPDGTKAYVSNYSMYGPGYGRQGDDKCSPSSGIDRSFVYRIDVATLKIDQLIEVGAVPKYVAVTPNAKYVLVTNWCTYDLSVIDVATGVEVQRLKMGRYPRGIVVSPDSSTAYVAIMGGRDIARVNLNDFSISWLKDVGGGPRHLVISPDGSTIYATLNKDGRVAKIDAASGQVIARVATGKQPRSMDISADGLSLYVVNYESQNMTKVSTGDMKVVQTVGTGVHPIGISYDRSTNVVWVAVYRGTIHRFAER